MGFCFKADCWSVLICLVLICVKAKNKKKHTAYKKRVDKKSDICICKLCNKPFNIHPSNNFTSRLTAQHCVFPFFLFVLIFSYFRKKKIVENYWEKKIDKRIVWMCLHAKNNLMHLSTNECFLDDRERNNNVIIYRVASNQANLNYKFLFNIISFN